MTFLMLIIVGAIIGGATNALAIRMLFRPIYPVYIGHWRMPFTPGLIPKRREALAKQLGDVVVDHLLTAEGVQTRLKNEQFRQGMITMVQNKVQTFLDSDQSIAALAGRLEIDNVQQRLESLIGTKVNEQCRRWIEKQSEKTLDDVFPPSFLARIEENIPTFSALVMEKVADYFDSSEGKRKIAELIDRFFADKGTFGSMLQMVLGNDSLINKVHPEVMKFLRQPTTKEMLEQMIQKQWRHLKKQPASNIFDGLNLDVLAEWIGEQTLRQLDVSRVLETPLRRLSASVQLTILEQWVPKAFVLFVDYLSDHIASLMKALQLAEIVRKQVESFSVQRLETMVLEVARRELKMIMVLGALLGGLIGAVQGVFLLLI